MTEQKHPPYKQYLDIVETLAEKALEEHGYELVDIEWKTSEGKPHIVVYIDTHGGVTLEHCQNVSKLLGEVMDREDPLPSSYFLEVSSPGIERRLKKEKDFVRFLGSDVRIKTIDKIDGSRNFRGTLKDFRGDSLVILLESGEEKELKLSDISKANLWYKDGAQARR